MQIFNSLDNSTCSSPEVVLACLLYEGSTVHNASDKFVSFLCRLRFLSIPTEKNLKEYAPTSNFTPIENWTHVYMNLFTRNCPYHHLLKYLLFLLKHPVYETQGTGNTPNPSRTWWWWWWWWWWYMKQGLKLYLTFTTYQYEYGTVREGDTSRKVVGLIPDSVIGIFHWYNPSGRTMALRYIQPLTEMSTRNISWGGKDSRWIRLTTLPPSCADCLEIWKPQPTGTLRACNRIVLPLHLQSVKED
jgi:hypothetical protein